MTNIEKYENEIADARLLLNCAHNYLTLGKISLKEALEIYNVIDLAMKKIEKADYIKPNIRYFINKHRPEFLRLFLIEITIFLFTGPIAFMFLPYILKKASDILNNVEKEYNEKNKTSVDIKKYCDLKRQLLNLKIIQIYTGESSSESMDEQVKDCLLTIADKVIIKIYQYIIKDQLEATPSLEAEMMLTMLQNELNSQSDNLTELLEDLKLQALNHTSLVRNLSNHQ